VSDRRGTTFLNCAAPYPSAPGPEWAQLEPALRPSYKLCQICLISALTWSHKHYRTLDEAFQDLRGLMANAQEMVHLAERFRETLAARGGGAGADGEVTDPEMQRELIEMGIASPVTKDTAGASYHQQLSREVRLLLPCDHCCSLVTTAAPL